MIMVVQQDERVEHDSKARDGVVEQFQEMFAVAVVLENAAAFNAARGGACPAEAWARCGLQNGIGIKRKDKEETQASEGG
jgi:hypothetical protein